MALFSFLLINIVLVHFIVSTICSNSNSKFNGPKGKFKYSGFTMTNDKYCPNVSYSSPIANDSLHHLYSIGANYVSIVVTEYQDKHNTTQIYPIYKNAYNCSPHYCITATIQELTVIINTAHQLKMGVMLKPQIDLLNDPNYWRGEIDFGDNITAWNQWFDQYSIYILKYANLSQLLNVELLSVSCELIKATTCNSCTDKWENMIIPQIKKIYKGKLTISANWADPITGIGELSEILWWKSVDYIGSDQYYVKSLSGNGINGTYPTMDELMNEWEPVVHQMTNLTNFWKMPIIFTEIGYCSGVISGTNDTCWCNGKESVRPSLPTNESLYAQYNQYEAALLSMHSFDWFLGFFWWNWPTDNGMGGDNDSCMTPAWKPTELLLREWYDAKSDPPPPPPYDPTCLCWE